VERRARVEELHHGIRSRRAGRKSSPAKAQTRNCVGMGRKGSTLTNHLNKNEQLKKGKKEPLTRTSSSTRRVRCKVATISLEIEGNVRNPGNRREKEKEQLPKKRAHLTSGKGDPIGTQLRKRKDHFRLRKKANRARPRRFRKTSQERVPENSLREDSAKNQYLTR